MNSWSNTDNVIYKDPEDNAHIRSREPSFAPCHGQVGRFLSVFLEYNQALAIIQYNIDMLLSNIFFTFLYFVIYLLISEEMLKTSWILWISWTPFKLFLSKLVQPGASYHVLFAFWNLGIHLIFCLFWSLFLLLINKYFVHSNYL